MTSKHSGGIRTGSADARRLLQPARAGAVVVGLMIVSVALASGFRPIALDDSITVARGGSVSILDGGARSVLANDFDVESDPLTASVRDEPKRGTLTLNADGTFVYVHNGSSNGSDDFEYRAFDGTRFSRDARVRITITDAPGPPRIVGQREIRVREDGTVEVQLDDLRVEDPDSNYPDDFTLRLGAGSNYTLNGAFVSPAANFTGTLSVPAIVNDGQFDSNQFALQIRVDPENDPPAVIGDIPSLSARVGQAFALDAAAYFFDPENEPLSFSATGLPPSGALTMSSSGLLAGVPVDGDTLNQPYQVTVTARDPGGRTATSSFILTVLPNTTDLALRVSAAPDPTTFGAAPQWTFEVENLAGPTTELPRLGVDWRSSGPAVALTAPASCQITGNGTAAPRLDCELGMLGVDESVRVRVQSVQGAAGDLAVSARVEVAGDANASNNAAFASLNLAGGFNEPPLQRLPIASQDIALGDLDEDGWIDLVSVAGGVSVFFNNALGQFESAAVIPAGDTAGETLALLDWNGDLWLDIVVLRRDSRPGTVFRNDGARGFAAVSTLPAVSARSAVRVDIEIDGFDEVAVAGDEGTVLLVPNDSAAADRIVLDPRPATAVAAADFNGDGLPDLAVVLATGDSVLLLESSSTGFVPRVLDGFGGLRGIGAADLTGDGAMDLLLATGLGGLDVPGNPVLVNDGSGSFSQLARFGATESRQLLAATVDNDAFADIVTINATGVHQIYSGDGGGALSLQPEFLLSPGAVKAEVGDLDGDQIADLVIAGTTIEVLRNNGIGRFGPGDVRPPVIELIGAANMTIKVASGYSDPGATATDDVSGDLTDQIRIDNPVDPNLVGTYKISYDVTDRAGNASSTVFRTVVVESSGGTGGGGGGGAGWPLLCVLGLLTLCRRAAAAKSE